MPGGGVELPPSKLRLEDVSVPAAVRSPVRKQKNAPLVPGSSSCLMLPQKRGERTLASDTDTTALVAENTALELRIQKLNDRSEACSHKRTHECTLPQFSAAKSSGSRRLSGVHSTMMQSFMQRQVAAKAATCAATGIDKRTQHV